MKRTISTEITFHLAKAQTMLADGEPQQIIQREINYAKALAEHFLDPAVKADNSEIQEIIDRVDIMSNTLNAFDDKNLNDENFN